MTFASWSYDQTMVNLVPSSIHLAEYDANTAWKLVKTRMSISSDDHRGFGSVTFPVITFTLKLRRASDIVFYYLYLPILFFNIITIAQYLLPCDSTKKITICECHIIHYCVCVCVRVWIYISLFKCRVLTIL